MRWTCLGVAVLGFLWANGAIAAEYTPDVVLDERGRPVDDARFAYIRELEAMENRGLSLMRSEKFEQAYEALSEAARHGLKRAQHGVALMHINGQGVEANVLVGVALLGLAAESGDRRLEKEYKNALKKLPKKYQSPVQQQTAYYIERYGMEVQGVTCARVKRPGSNMKTLECMKQPGDYPDIAWTP